MPAAYWLEGVPAAESDGHPFHRQIVGGAPWEAIPHDGGSLFLPRRTEQRRWKVSDFDLTRMRPAMPLFEGAHYIPAVELPTQADLARRHRNSLDKDLELFNGRVLTIECALVAPECIGFGGSEPQGYATEYGRKAWDFWQKCEDNDKNYDIMDPDALEVVYLAISSRYRVTRDLLTDLRWISSEDISPILEVAFGADPKSLSAGSDT